MQLAYSRDELLSEHAYQAPHVVQDRAFHGGFDADGRYLSPRSKRRLGAVRSWGRALRDRGGELHSIEFDPSEVPPYPNQDQHRHLIRTGHDDLLWDALTQVGRAEAQGRALLTLRVPDFGEVLSDDTSEWLLGHLGGGLLEAHAFDEAGDPAGGPGAHDSMWYMVRDLSLGTGKYPIPAEPKGSPPRTPTRRIPEIPEAHEQFVRFMMVLLLIEVRALSFMGRMHERLTDPGLFADRAEQAREAASLITRIRQDEAIHVSGLRVFLGELYQATFETPDGPRPGRELLAPVWAVHVRFLNSTAPQFEARMARSQLAERLASRSGGEQLLEELAALDDKL